MENEKTPLYVAFSTQKGGVGKTTFTVLPERVWRGGRGLRLPAALHRRDAQTGC